MYSRRDSERVHSSRHCILSHDHQILDCHLEDISDSGALVRCKNAAGAQGLKNGDLCVIELDDPQLSHRRLRCSVSRRNANRIGLQFLYLDKATTP